MKNGMIKKIAVGLVASGIALSAGYAFAQEPDDGPPTMRKHRHMTDEQRLERQEKRLDRRLERMTDELNLTKDQQAKIRQIFSDAQTQMQDIRQRAKGDRKAARTQARGVFKDAKKKVDAVLTPKQKARRDQLKQRHFERRKQRMLDNLDDRLQLSAKQRGQIAKIMDDTHAQMLELKDQAPDGRREKGKAIFEKSADRIEAVLNAKQKKKFERMKAERKERMGHRRGHRRHRGPRPF